MPDTSKDHPDHNVQYPYKEESKQDRKATKAKKKLYSKRSFKNNHEKLQWLRGDGPQTD